MTTKWTPDGTLDTPYRRARQEWDARMGSAVVHAKNWRLATFASMSAVVLATGGMTYLGSLPKAVPHIIEVDRLGAERVAKERKTRERLRGGELGLDFYGLRARLAELGVRYVEEEEEAAG